MTNLDAREERRREAGGGRPEAGVGRPDEGEAFFVRAEYFQP